MSAHVTNRMSEPGDGGLAWDEAARLLDVPPAALRQWSELLAFPCDIGRSGSPRFRRAEIEALRDALPEAHSVRGAIRVARARTPR